MPYPRKADPAKTCRYCGQPLERKRINDRLEDRAVFLRRHFCDRACMAANMEGKIKVLNEQNSRRQSAKTNTGICSRCGRLRSATRLYVHHRDRNPLNNAPDNLETLCGRCHRTDHASPKQPCRCCNRPARWKGFCGKHWQRFKRYGDPRAKKLKPHGPVVLVED